MELAGTTPGGLIWLPPLTRPLAPLGVVYVDGTEVTRTPETTVTLDHLAAGTTYTLSVATCDIEGNVSEHTTVEVKTETST